MKELEDLEAKLGRRFTSHALLEQALTHGSVRHEQKAGDAASAGLLIEDNERLEFLGDAIVGMVVGELLYRRYPELDEGALTRLRAALVSRRHLGLVGMALELGSYLRLGRAEERNGGRRKPVLLANCMEALIGALYLEGGLAAAAAFVERAVVTPYLDSLRDELRENRAIGDYKTALQELLQARRAGQPEYVVEAESGPDHRKRFVVEVRVSPGEGAFSVDKNRAQAEGSTKKKAAQEAARRLYERLTGRAQELFAGEPAYRRAGLPEQTLLSASESSDTSADFPGRLSPEMDLPFDNNTSDAAALYHEEHPMPAETGPAVRLKKRRQSAPRPAGDAAAGADRPLARTNEREQVRMDSEPGGGPDDQKSGKHAASGTLSPKSARLNGELTGKSSR